MSTAAMQQLSPEQLWEFSLACYPRVKALCLRWQDLYQANVNIILALCYAERLSWQTNQDNLTQTIQKIAPLNTQVTQILRQCRQQITGLPLDQAQQLQLKQNLLSTELIAEQIEQQLLCRYFTFATVTAADNLSLYVQQLHLPLTETLTADLIDLRQVCAQIPLGAA